MSSRSKTTVVPDLAEAGPSDPGALVATDDTGWDPTFYIAIEHYLESHVSIESTGIFDITFKEIREAPTLEEVFLTPIRRALLGYQEAICWLVFLHFGQQEAARSGGVLPEPLARPLSLVHALAQVEKVYDRAMVSEVWDHFDADSSEDESSDEGSDDGRDEDAGE